jgi:hypothetical protein
LAASRSIPAWIAAVLIVTPSGTAPKSRIDTRSTARALDAQNGAESSDKVSQRRVC